MSDASGASYSSGGPSVQDAYSGDSGPDQPPMNQSVLLGLSVQCPTCMQRKFLRGSEQQARMLQHRMCGTCRMSMTSNWWLNEAFYVVQCHRCTHQVLVPVASYNAAALYACVTCQ